MMTHHTNPEPDAIDLDTLFAPLSERERVYALENLTPINMCKLDAFMTDMRSHLHEKVDTDEDEIQEWLYEEDGTDE